MALSNAEKQKRWREKRNELAVALTGKPNEVADNISAILALIRPGRLVGLSTSGYAISSRTVPTGR